LRLPVALSWTFALELTREAEQELDRRANCLLDARLAHAEPQTKDAARTLDPDLQQNARNRLLLGRRDDRRDTGAPDPDRRRGIHRHAPSLSTVAYSRLPGLRSHRFGSRRRGLHPRPGDSVARPPEAAEVPVPEDRVSAERPVVARL